MYNTTSKGHSTAKTYSLHPPAVGITRNKCIGRSDRAITMTNSVLNELRRYYTFNILCLTELYYAWSYAMVGSIPHAIVFGMCHIVCRSIPHDHVVCILAKWYVFLEHVVSFFQTTKKFNLVVRND